MKHLAVWLFLFCVTIIATNDVPPQRTFIEKARTPLPSKELQYKQLLQIAPIVVHADPASVVWLGWSPDEQRLGVVYEDEHIIRILDAVTGKVELTINVPESTAQGTLDLAWSPDGKRLAGTFDITYGTSNGIIKMWDLSGSSAQLVVNISRPNGRTSGLDWSPDGTKLSSVHFSSTFNSDALSIWDAQTGALLLTKNGVAIGTWSPDGKKMLIYTQTLQIVDPNTFQVLAEIPDKTSNIFSAYTAWAADSRRVVGTKCEPSRGDLCHLWAWDIQTGRLFENFDQTGFDPRGYVEASPLALSHSDNLLSKVESQSNILELWDMGTGAAFSLPIGETNYITMFCWHPNKDIIAVGGTDGIVQIWEIQTRFEEAF